MLVVHAFTALPVDEKPARKANPAFNRMVHAYNAKKGPRAPMLEPEQEKELIMMAKDQGCTDAMNSLVKAHMGFLVNIANNAARYNGLEDHVEDLYSEAAEGFMDSVKKFDPTRGARIATHAKYYASSRCYRYIMDMKHPFRVGTNIHDKKVFYGLPRLRAEFFEVYGRPMTSSDEDLEKAEMLSGISQNALKRGMELERSGAAIHHEELQIHDMRFQDQPQNQMAQKSGRKCIQDHIHKVADTLIDRDRDILLTMINDMDNLPQLVRSCATRHAISPERVRQIYRGAVSDIRKSLEDAGMRHISDVA
jgi:RNA polymerase sigma-32 factor